jgi:PAS domain-containing protein
MKDEAGLYVYANKPVERLLPHWRGQTDFELWPRETAQVIRDNDAKVLATNAPAEFYETVPYENGNRWLWSFRFPIQGAAGQRLLAGLSLDITERRHFEALQSLLAPAIEFLEFEAGRQR